MNPDQTVSSSLILVHFVCNEEFQSTYSSDERADDNCRESANKSVNHRKLCKTLIIQPTQACVYIYLVKNKKQTLITNNMERI